MARRKQKHVGTLTNLVEYVEMDYSSEYGVDSTALIVLESLEDKVSDELWHFLYRIMLGFNADMQLEIADDLLNFVCHQMIQTTGCFSADAALITCYRLIAEEKGYTDEEIDAVLKKVI
jgi:hypothetical protein